MFLDIAHLVEPREIIQRYLGMDTLVSPTKPSRKANHQPNDGGDDKQSNGGGMAASAANPQNEHHQLNDGGDDKQSNGGGTAGSAATPQNEHHQLNGGVNGEDSNGSDEDSDDGMVKPLVLGAPKQSPVTSPVNTFFKVSKQNDYTNF